MEEWHLQLGMPTLGVILMGRGMPALKCQIWIKILLDFSEIQDNVWYPLVTQLFHTIY